MLFSTPTEFDEAYQSTRASFDAGLTKNKEWRRRQLRRFWWMLEDNKEAVCSALYKDLHKHRLESQNDFLGVQKDILHTLENFDHWTAEKKPARTNLLNFIGGTTIRKEPLGLTLIIGAWNFPFLLLLQPLVAAIAAGCAVILKPSDLAVASQDLLMDMVPKYLDPRAIRIISAGPQEMGYILEHRFNHIFYTGSSKVAKIIHTSAAKNLTPVTLELGGQGPAIVTKSANIELSAKRLAATKFTNAGQICLNVNHVLVDPSVREVLISRLAYYFDLFLGGEKQRPSYYTTIINDRNFDRLETLLQKSNGKILYGGDRDPVTRFFGPTIVLVSPDDILLSEELFGPILPIIEANLGTALAYTASQEHPLALYAFTNDADEKKRILDRSLSGGVTFNDCMLHAMAKDAPFGGVGQAGMGYYHGSYGIDAFSHLRTYINGAPAWLDGLMAFRYPPYTLENAKKVLPRSQVTFDREGNVVKSSSGVAKLSLGLVLFASTAYMLAPRLRNAQLISGLIK